MSIRMTPLLGAKGLYQLRVPFTITNTKVFTCHAIRSFKDMEEMGQDVYMDVYNPVGLTTGDYEQDIELNAAIVTLIADDDDIVYVPDTYIQSYPNMDQVEYHRVVMSMDFGPIPKYVDFRHAMEQLGNVGTEVIGKMPQIHMHYAPVTGVFTPAQHAALEAARNDAIQNKETDYARYLEQLRINERIVEQNKMFMKIIEDAGLLAPP